MNRKNSFSERTQVLMLVDADYECAYCKKNHANSLHHIHGRGKSEGCEKSPLNACPLNNNECHLPHHGWLMTNEGKKFCMEWTMRHLLNQGYKLKDQDVELLEKYEVHKLGLNIAEL